MLSDEWLPRYRLLENFTAKWNGNGNGNAYDRGDYNSSFALRAVELKIIISKIRKKCPLKSFYFAPRENSPRSAGAILFAYVSKILGQAYVGQGILISS